jgi:hypothetical protein
MQTVIDTEFCQFEILDFVGRGLSGAESPCI